MKEFKKPGDIHVGILGYGRACNMGKYHLEAMKEVGMTPTTVMDIDPSRLEAAKQDFPDIKTYSSLAQMLKKADVDLILKNTTPLQKD